MSCTPPLKWVGGKRKLLSELRRALPRDFSKRQYTELFAGGAALFFDLQPGGATLCDVNSELIWFYRYLRDRPCLLVAAIEKLKTQEYSQVREAFNQHVRCSSCVVHCSHVGEGIRQAARFFYLNKMGFNGLYRENLAGEFNVPRGSSKELVFSQGKIHEASRALLTTTLKTGSVFSTEGLGLAGSRTCDSFIYADPPYDSLKDVGFTSYSAGGFGRLEQHDLMVMLRRAASAGAKVMVSNANTGFIRNTYKHFYVSEVFGSRSINSDGNGRGKVVELLITSYKPGT